MDNKPIIDGVDVSECIFYQVNFEEDLDVKIKHFCSNWHNSCESDNNSNCYFKQLARKTQECEQKEKDIKYLIKCLDNSFKTQQDSELYWEREKKKLKAENEELKEQYCNGLDEYKICRTLQYVSCYRDKAEQKLEKIREYCNKYPQNSIGFKKNILQILDGVE